MDGYKNKSKIRNKRKKDLMKPQIGFLKTLKKLINLYQYWQIPNKTEDSNFKKNLKWENRQMQIQQRLKQ